jgi:3',5'-cyclic AMP phosphodiesterase CpdA
MAKKKAKTKTAPSVKGAARQTSATAAAGGFAFANPKQSADDYDTFNPKDVFADTNVKASGLLQPVPKPWKQPPVMALQDVLGQAVTQQITAADSITFHCVGDSGGIKEPSKQFAVADAMTADLANKDYASGRPAFFYHLGDVVYYLGQELYYYDQFYDPYRDYDAPIIAIPGNHDGMISSSLKLKTLQGFLENFCTKTPGHNPEAQGHARTTMTQPGVYFTLDAPFVKFIGLYSNTSEGATEGVISGKVVGPDQLDFLQQQLKTAATQRSAGNRFALVIAVHHPPFTGSSDHAPSPTMLKQIDAACSQAKILPDLVLSGHAHLYERYTRFLGGNQIPFVVAGCGGYFNLSGFKKGRNGATPKTPVMAADASGNKLRLDNYNDATFGFLRLTVSATQLQCQFLGVDVNTKAVSVADHFTLDLVEHVVS